MPMILTPWETYEGWQDEANGTYVAGWVWDRRYPNVPVSVEVYDGNTLLTTIVADLFRKDLRDVGKGNGRHGFVCSLRAHVRGRRPHQITVRVAGTPAVLRDTTTGMTPQPVRRRDAFTATSIPHLSLPPYARWFYFTFLRTLLRPFPRPIWHLPAALLASLRVVRDRDTWRLDMALSDAFGQSRTRWMRVRSHWWRCYLHECDVLLLLQTDRLTRQWAARKVRCDGALPSGGAVLIAPHHAMGRIGNLRFAAMVEQLGAISNTPRNTAWYPHADPTLLHMWQLSRALEEEACGAHRYRTADAGRQGLRLLRNGGYLIVLADNFLGSEPLHPFLGRAIPLPRGAAWFSQRSGKPIIPWMMVPNGRRWCLWLGDAVPPTQEGVVAGLEACIRQSPASWQQIVAMSWLEAAAWQTTE